MSLYVAASQDDMDAQIAAFCREHWQELGGDADTLDRKNDMDQITYYFTRQGQRGEAWYGMFSFDGEFHPSKTFPCDGCGAETPLHLLDGKPSARAMAWHGTLDAALAANSEIDRFLCEACYGPGWSASTEYTHRHEPKGLTDDAP